MLVFRDSDRADGETSPNSTAGFRFLPARGCLETLRDRQNRRTLGRLTGLTALGMAVSGAGALLKFRRRSFWEEEGNRKVGIFELKEI